MNSTDPVTGQGAMRAKHIVQHVCELIPTVTLFPDTTSTTQVSPTLLTPSSQTYSSSSRPSHHYTGSYSSHQSFDSSITSRIQNPYPTPQGSTQHDYHPAPPHSTYTSSHPSSQYSHSTLLPQHSYSATQGSELGYIQPQVPTVFAPQQGYVPGPDPINSHYYNGGYSRPMASQQDPHSWRP